MGQAKWLALIVIACAFLVPQVKAAGVTVITHGFGGDAQGWVLGMAARMPNYYRFVGTNVICYEVRVTYSGGFNVTSSKVAGGHPTNDFNAEIVIKLDWSDLAGFFAQYDTYEVAAAVVPRFLQTNFISELGGRALAELPLHLIGHSRGGSLVCEMARQLGMNGIWVDQVTTLDPHPVNEDGNVDPLAVTDAPLRIYQNVLFADNIYQEFGGYPDGQLMPGAYNRRLTTLPGGHSSAHSDTHLWYHATIDLRNPADDTEATLAASDRARWFSAFEQSGAQAGFFYSRIAGGSRISTNQPAGPGTDRIGSGFNQWWNLGAGQANNRTVLPSNNGGWPNLIRLNLTGTNVMAQGQSNSVTLYAQWAKPSGSNATVSIYLDDDFNPFNGNGEKVRTLGLSGTGSNQIAFGSIDLNVAQTNSTPGLRSIYAKVTDGVRSRYLYAPETLTVMSSFEQPRLAIEESSSSVQVSVEGIPGQRIILEATSDFITWTPLGTNWLSSPIWHHIEPQANHRFYRALVR